MGTVRGLGPGDLGRGGPRRASPLSSAWPCRKTGQTTVVDRLRGEVHFENTQIDDQILMKDDGFPTYHLANVVDDT